MADTKMNYTLKDRLLQFTTVLQRDLFAWQEAEELAFTSKPQEQVGWAEERSPTFMGQ
jgi:hypothetical protein